MSRGKSKHVAKVERPCQGVATYRTETGAWVYHACIEADPLKDQKWIDMVASSYAGGEESVEFLQEFRADDDAKSGERLYWAFDRDRNVVPWSSLPGGRVPKDWPVYLGGDFGQRVPTAIVFLAQDPKTRRIYVFDSIYQPRGVDPAVKLKVYEKLSAHFDVPLETMALEGAYRYIERAVADPTAAPYIAFYALEPLAVNFIIRAGAKLPSRHRPGESKVNSGLWPSMVCCGKRQYPSDSEEPPELWKCAFCSKDSPLEPVIVVLDGAAPELVAEWEDLIDKPAAFEGLETPEVKVKAPDHACLVAGTLVATPSGEVPIEALRVGDLVLTHLGPRPVTRAWNSHPSADVFRLALPSGREIVGTGNHPFWTSNRGWVDLDALRYADILVACETSSESSSTESRSGATPTPSSGAIGSTSRREARTARGASGDCTRKSGRRITGGRFRLDTTSTTRTTTRSTTFPETWTPSRSVYTSSTTTASHELPLWLPSSWPAPLPLRGIVLTPAERGTPSTASGHGTTVSRSVRRASNAVPSTSRSTRGTRGSARTTARPPTVVPPGQTRKHAYASSAALTLPPTATSRPATAPASAGRSGVVAVPAGSAAVYALTVAEAHSFFAEGVLVSNSDGFRYVCFDLDWGGEGVEETSAEENARRLEKLKSKHPSNRTYEDHMELLMARAQETYDRAQAGKLQGHGKLSTASWGLGGRAILYREPGEEKAKMRMGRPT